MHVLSLPDPSHVRSVQQSVSFLHVPPVLLQRWRRRAEAESDDAARGSDAKEAINMMIDL